MLSPTSWDPLYHYQTPRMSMPGVFTWPSTYDNEQLIICKITKPGSNVLLCNHFHIEHFMFWTGQWKRHRKSAKINCCAFAARQHCASWLMLTRFPSNPRWVIDFTAFESIFIRFGKNLRKFWVLLKWKLVADCRSPRKTVLRICGESKVSKFAMMCTLYVYAWCSKIGIVALRCTNGEH